MLKVNLNTLKVSKLSNNQSQASIKKNDNFKSLGFESNYSLQNLQAYYLNGVNKVNFKGVDKASEIELGSAYNPKTNSVDFGIFSKNATRIQLEIFDKPINGEAIAKIPLKREGDKWVSSISNEELIEKGIDVKAGDAFYYGYRAWGKNFEYDPNWSVGSADGFKSHVDEEGNRFNPNKLLTDPYAIEISHDPISPQNGVVDDSVYKTGEQDYLKDSSKQAPKSVFVIPAKVDVGPKPLSAIKDDVIYETHIKGFTMNDKSIPEEYRGTYKGAAMKAEYLRKLGITMVEFLPVQEAGNDQNDFEGFDHNYWGYMTLSYFAPDRRYSSDKTPGGPTKEFKEMVDAFHQQDIKVAMDVVYNHTGEADPQDEAGKVVNLYSMMGLDNSSYYETKTGGNEYCKHSGCGANYNIANPDAQKLVKDSLIYWAKEMGVDAFRHDLASVLGNIKEKDGFEFDANSDKSYIKAITKNMKIRDRKGGYGIDLIAEPWAAGGDNSYQVGGFPKQWQEWNDKYRDAIRRYLNRQDSTPFSTVANAISGSQDEFYANDYTRSVNFITAHDGFTMKDMVSYNNKINYGDYGSSNGGSDDNISWDTQGDEIKQRKAVRNAMTMLMLSKGTPMIVGGDEILRTTLGNNNPWNQDESFNWIDWEMDDKKSKMLEYTKGIIQFRNIHSAIRNPDFYPAVDNNNNGLKAVTWLKRDAQEAQGEYFDNPDNSYLGMRIDGT